MAKQETDPLLSSDMSWEDTTKIHWSELVRKATPDSFKGLNDAFGICMAGLSHRGKFVRIGDLIVIAPIKSGKANYYNNHPNIGIAATTMAGLSEELDKEASIYPKSEWLTKDFIPGLVDVGEYSFRTEYGVPTITISGDGRGLGSPSDDQRVRTGELVKQMYADIDYGESVIAPCEASVNVFLDSGGWAR